MRQWGRNARYVMMEACSVFSCRVAMLAPAGHAATAS